MSGIYIHIPFCKQACHYCDFHFSTSLKKKGVLIQALIREIELRKEEFHDTTVETIYFGGGTPSLLSNTELVAILSSVYDNYNISENPEITIEANPDDLNEQRIMELANTDINRLSIGIQSFSEPDLKFMNRAHNASEAHRCLKIGTKFFDNISVDLIYGIPGATHEIWRENIKTALSYGIPHISSYALTVEPKTALHAFIKKGLVEDVNDDITQEQFEILTNELKSNQFVHYELSNFGKKGYFSKNNSAYWQGKTYLGIGPSAHSFDGEQRSWNVSNNSKYINALKNNELPSTIEVLSVTDQYNEYIMTGLRTIWGVSISAVESDFGTSYKDHLLEQAQKHINEHLLYIEDDILKVSSKGKFLSDGIASDLFKLN